jgi:hypothetical protein
MLALKSTLANTRHSGSKYVLGAFNALSYTIDLMRNFFRVWYVHVVYLPQQATMTGNYPKPSYTVMIRPMFGYRPKPKKFDLPFRYYDPDKDEREKRRKRIKFQTHNRVKPKQNVRVLALALFLSLVVYLISIL